jgi:3-hydroxybutyryl-CoA dehydrogenase
VIERIGVVGAGTMGAGIAQVAALGGLETSLFDPVEGATERGLERIAADLDRGRARGRWSEGDAAAARGRLDPAAAVADLGRCELVIEAAPEDLELKRKLFAELAGACCPEAVLATNTSSLSVTAIAAGVERPERVVGMHFFNPPALMRLVEVVAGDETGPDAVAAAVAVAEAIGRTPIRAADGIGFLANRCLRPFTLEALRLVTERIAPPDQVDRIVRIGGGFRMGPFELMDLVGVDVNLEVARSFWEQSFHEPRWRPSPLQTRLVDSGRLGRKSGRGWYRYDEGPHRPDDPEPPAAAAALAAANPIRVEGPDFVAVNLADAPSPTLPDDALAFVALPDLATATVVELARGPAASAEALSAAGRHFASLGKHVECVLAPAPGLVLGRILCQLVNEACFALGEGVGSAADIDAAMRLGFNWPRGPFELATAIGAERVLATLDALHRFLGEERYRVAPELRRLAAGAAWR